MRRVLAGALLGLAGLLAAPALAADHTITAGPTPDTYADTSVTIDQGDTVTFTNDDSGGFMHDVTADKKTADGKPIFKSATIKPGNSAPVAGVDFLKTGDYGYHCAVHPLMKGTLHVSASGTPKAGPAPPPDTTPPDASVAIADSKIATVLKRRALRVALTTNEPASFALTAKAARTVIAKGTLQAKGAKRASIALTRAGRKLLAKSRTLTVRLIASVSDSAGNRSAASATRRLRR